jgi:hypothetical protein
VCDNQDKKRWRLKRKLSITFTLFSVEIRIVKMDSLSEKAQIMYRISPLVAVESKSILLVTISLFLIIELANYITQPTYVDPCSRRNWHFGASIPIKLSPVVG